MRRALLVPLFLLALALPAGAAPADPGIPATSAAYFPDQGPPHPAIAIDVADLLEIAPLGKVLYAAFDGGTPCHVVIYRNAHHPPAGVPVVMTGLRNGRSTWLLQFPAGVPLPCYLGAPGTALTAVDDPAAQTLTVTLP